MIEVKNINGHTQVSANGSPMEMAMDISVVAGMTYKMLRNTNEKDAGEFKRLVTTVMSNPNAPIWNDLPDPNFGVCIPMKNKRTEDK